MVTAQTQLNQTERVDFGRLWWVGLLAAVVAAIANGLIFLIASAIRAIPNTVLLPPQNEPMTVLMPIVSSAIPAILATILFAIIGRFARRPIRLFRIIAVVFLVLSLGSPLSIPGAPTSMIIALEVMHVVAAAIIIGILTTMGRRQER